MTIAAAFATLIRDYTRRIHAAEQAADAELVDVLAARRDRLSKLASERHRREKLETQRLHALYA